MVELSFDFDDHNLHKFVPALQRLHSRYGNAVRVRRSSSGRGWHIWVHKDLSPKEELDVREELGDCIGRLEGDFARLGGGMRTSRLFTVKGKKCKGRTVVREAGKWMTYEEWKEENDDCKGEGSKEEADRQRVPSQRRRGA